MGSLLSNLCIEKANFKKILIAFKRFFSVTPLEMPNASIFAEPYGTGKLIKLSLGLVVLSLQFFFISGPDHFLPSKKTDFCFQINSASPGSPSVLGSTANFLSKYPKLT